MSQFSSEMVAACKAAVEKNIFYDDEFKQFVFAIVGFQCTANLLDHIVIDNTGNSSCDRAKRDRDTYSSVDERVRAAPRGSYIVIEVKNNIGDQISSSYKTVVSAGYGSIAAGGKYDFYKEFPSPEEILTRMVHFEIHECRKLCESEKHKEDCMDCIRTYNLRVGMRFEKLKLDAFAKPITAIIQSIDHNTGVVRLYTKQRSNTLFYNIPAARLVLISEIQNKSLVLPPAAQATGNLFLS